MHTTLSKLIVGSLLLAATPAIAEPIIVMRPPVAGMSARVLPNDAFATKTTPAPGNTSSPVDASAYDYISENFEDERFKNLPIEYLTIYQYRLGDPMQVYWDLERFKKQTRPTGLALKIPSMSGFKPSLSTYTCDFGHEKKLPPGTMSKLTLRSSYFPGGIGISAFGPGKFAVTVQCGPSDWTNATAVWSGELARLIITVPAD